MRHDLDEYPLLYSKVEEIEDKYFRQLLDSLAEISPQPMHGLVVQFLIQALNPYPGDKKRPIKKENIGFHAILLEKIIAFKSSPVFPLCMEMVRMFRKGEHIDNYDQMQLYVFLNKIIPKSTKPKTKKKGK